MRTVTLEDAQRDLLHLLRDVARGEGVIVSEGGPLVQVLPLARQTAPPKRRRFGHLRGRMSVPEDVDDRGQAEIEAMFYGETTSV